MLHCSMLPVHRQFGHFLANLRYIVVDEGHAYRGVFGCHAALVLRRLRRICQREYRRCPQFIVASATIANPAEHIQQLLGMPATSLVLLACRTLINIPAEVHCSLCRQQGKSCRSLTRHLHNARMPVRSPYVGRTQTYGNV